MKTIFFFFAQVINTYLNRVQIQVIDKPDMGGYVGFGFGGVKKIVIYML
jgi:hypothetical protein